VPEDNLLSRLGAIDGRRLADGGFGGAAGGGYRPDATAWSILAFLALGEDARVVAAARQRLAQDQLDDGRVPIDPRSPQIFWPTSLAALAWHGAPLQSQNEEAAVDFLLRTTGLVLRQGADFPGGHDPSLRGWPWVSGCSSWVEPTALAVIALRFAGRGDSDRVAEGAKMLTDRQLPDGGWNSGNTLVFGKELLPMPAFTGMALQALAGTVPRQAVEKSVHYLREQVAQVRTPMSLGWGLLALGAWGVRPKQAGEWVFDSLDRQKVYGVYDTASLSLLAVAYLSEKGLMNLPILRNR
jgi:hypothetical protein